MYSNILGLAVSFSGIHGLPSLLDRRENRLVRHRGIGDNACCLRVEVHVKRFNAYCRLIVRISTGYAVTVCMFLGVV